VNAWTLE